MCQININYVNDNMSQKELDSFGSKMFALGLYSEGKTSMGVCADIAGMNLLEFMQFLGEHGQPVFKFNDYDELLRDVENA